MRIMRILAMDYLDSGGSMPKPEGGEPRRSSQSQAVDAANLRFEILTPQNISEATTTTQLRLVFALIDRIQFDYGKNTEAQGRSARPQRLRPREGAAEAPPEKGRKGVSAKST
jgi:hypothetical protein